MSPQTAVRGADEDTTVVAWPFRFEVLSLAEIYIDRFQRPLNERWLDARDGKFDPAMLGTITVSDRPRRGKQYSAIDGQHRCELARRAGLSHVPCLVFIGLTVEAEAEMFARLQRERRAISPFQRFNAELVAGNEQAKAIQKIVTECGLTLDANQEDAGKVRAVVALERIYEDEPANLRKVLTLITQTWGDLPYARNERMLKGVWYFVRDTEDLDEERFIDRLGQVPPSTLATRATQLRDGSGMSRAGLPKFLREAIENEYRSKRRSR